MIYASHVVLFG